ncbi:HutD/Ves family protein [Arenibaculum pallidiluteum]|uniref:HutD/Ves family protein n=1 Tax=Arenibaculum pallidiluteum TaxID=2812559 RepID=UPI001A966093|nr:HutD family protein [Arenibaculum pallidiluteum]
MRGISRAEFRRMPWKNGGGETVEVAISPPGAALDAFDWRVSMATVAVPGPFSAFPGIDRTLAVLDGTLALRFAGRETVRLDLASPPMAFPADLPVEGEPVGGPVTDLNVMTRRGAFRHRLARIDAVEPMRIERQGDLMLVLDRAGDAWLVEDEPAIPVVPRFVVDLWRV